MDYKELARQAAIAEGLDPDLFDRVVNAESAYKPDAISPAGAIGLSQLMPGTAKELGVDPHDPEQNLRGGARYLKKQLDTFGSPELALAAYNAGPGAVRKHNGIPPFKETQKYVSKIMGNRNPVDVSAGPMSGPNALQRQPQPQQQRNPLSGLMQMGIMEQLLSGGQQQDPNGLGALLNDPMVALGSNILANSGRGNFMGNVGKGLKATSEQQLVRDTAQNKQKSNFISNYLKINEAMSGDPTSAMQNYEYLIAQGLSPEDATDRAFKQGTTVNVGAGVPSGYRPIHPLRPEAGLEPIPGTAEYQKRAAQERAVNTAYNSIDQLSNNLKMHGEGMDLMGNQDIQGQNDLHASQLLNQIAQLGNAGVLQQSEMEYYSTLVPDLNAKFTLAGRKDIENKLATLREIIQQRTGIKPNTPAPFGNQGGNPVFNPATRKIDGGF